MQQTNQRSGLIHKIEGASLVRAIRDGLSNMIPVLIIGAFALILNTLPIAAYQSFIQNFLGGFLSLLFNMVNSATFGVLSVYLTFSISRSFMKIKADRNVVSGGAVFASLISFFILSGTNLDQFGKDDLGPKSMFLAILTGLGASWIYLSLSRVFSKSSIQLFSEGANRDFNRMLSTLAPIAITAVFFALLNGAVIRLFHVDSFRELIADFFNFLFSFGANGFFKGLFFVLLSSVLWFFGIHGSDTLEDVMQKYFVPGLTANQAAVAAGEQPSQILTKEFFDCFVLIGGCGTTLCLLIAILLFSKNHARKRLGFTAAFPMLFNINELMVFGLPIILNPVMLIPFLAVPVISYSVSYLAVSLGIVPMVTHSVEWTTPIILGGFRATGSVSGALLQIVLLVIGVLVYFPFVRLLDNHTEQRTIGEYKEFMDFFRKNEQELAGVSLLDRGDIYGDFAKGLCADLKHRLTENIVMAYQPQYHYDGHCIGVEALLRWRHPVHGILYPPLVIKLAEEGGFLADLEEEVLLRALRDRPRLLERFGKDIKLSVNVTGTTVMTKRYLQFCRQINEKDPFAGKNICIEVTEQAALAFSADTDAILRELHNMGVLLAIDDFSMGQTSIHYLKDNLFQIIKLDGSLVRGIFDHQYSREIISSLVSLASSIDLMVLAEFVETNEQKEALHEMGCDCYQGYLYSPAVFLDDPKQTRKEDDPLKRQNVIYYRDEANDEFSTATIRARKIDETYRYERKGIFASFLRFFWVRIIWTLPAFLYVKLVLHQRTRGREKLKPFRKTGLFLYGNHTQQIGDPFTPNVFCFPRKVSFLVHANNVSIPFLGRITPYLGAIPLPDTLAAYKNFSACIAARISSGHAVVIYPEAHIWPYYTKIRPFPDASFEYPAKLNVPVFCFVNTYRKHGKRKKPDMETWLEGPFYPDMSLPLRQRRAKLKEEVAAKMAEFASRSDVEYIRYIKDESVKQ